MPQRDLFLNPEHPFNKSVWVKTGLKCLCPALLACAQPLSYRGKTNLLRPVLSSPANCELNRKRVMSKNSVNKQEDKSDSWDYEDKVTTISQPWDNLGRVPEPPCCFYVLCFLLACCGKCLKQTACVWNSSRADEHRTVPREGILSESFPRSAGPFNFWWIQHEGLARISLAETKQKENIEDHMDDIQEFTMW